MAKAKRRKPKPSRPERAGTPAVGDTVEIREAPVRGEVVAVNGMDKEAEVAVGDTRIRLGTHRLSPALAQEDSGDHQGAFGADVSQAPSAVRPELHVRKLRADDALMRVEVFLDRSFRDGSASVRIVHGRGTGTLRRLIREQLAEHPLVSSFRPELAHLGGEGVTVVDLV